MAELIRRKEISPVELVRAHIERAEAAQPKVNAFVTLDAERALDAARAAEAALAGKAAVGVLHGIPITIKSAIDVQGLVCAAGSALRRRHVPHQDAPLVARLRAAGAIILGNSNVPEFLMAYETNNALYGPTRNPWDVSRTAGGSSGGEAAAIAAGCSAGGVGSDGGGSIRVPAHFCGISGLKPTPGRIPMTGHFPPGGGAFSWIGVAGPMARTVGDLRLLFEIMAGPDAGDALSAPVPVRQLQDEGLPRPRIGLVENDALGPTTPETEGAVQRAAQSLEEQGFALEPLRLEGLSQALELWRFFFMRAIGHLLREATAGEESKLSPMLREYLEVSAEAPPITLDKFLGACVERDACRAEFLRQMEKVPILLSPVSATPAFPHGEGTWHKRKGGAPYQETMRHSQWVNLAGLPAVVVPVGFSMEGLPIGVQVIGRAHEDELVLAVAERIERTSGGSRPAPV
jgi:Asp-tRNA(Asn)/Glu-tRNA(Gln) amidotransferase A subunit family amidase